MLSRVTPLTVERGLSSLSTVKCDLLVTPMQWLPGGSDCVGFETR